MRERVVSGIRGVRFWRAALAVGLVLLAGSGSVGHSAMANGGPPSPDRAGHEAGDHVRLVLYDGRTLVGKLVSLDASRLELETTVGAITRVLTIEQADVREIAREEPSQPDGASDVGDGPEGSGSADKDELAVTGSGDDGTDDAEPDAAATGGAVVIELRGVVGEDVTGELLTRALDRAARHELDVVLLSLELEGGYTAGLVGIAEALEHARAEHAIKLIALVAGECRGVGAGMALLCDDVWFTASGSLRAGKPAAPTGHNGPANTMTTGDVERINEMAAAAALEGRPTLLMQALLGRKPRLYAKTEGTPWQLVEHWSPGSDGVRLSASVGELNVDHALARNLGVSKGTVSFVGDVPLLVSLRDDALAQSVASLVVQGVRAARREVDDARATLTEVAAFYRQTRSKAITIPGMTDRELAMAQTALRTHRREVERIERMRKRHEHFEVAFDGGHLTRLLRDLDELAGILERRRAQD